MSYYIHRCQNELRSHKYLTTFKVSKIR